MATSPARCGSSSGRTSSRMRCQSGPSPTGCIRPLGSPPGWTRSSSATLAPTGTSIWTRRSCGRASRRSPPVSSARRFATYKRATLLFRDPARLARLLNDPQRPVQIVFAGKAHPADQPGQDFIRQVYELSRMPEFEGRVVFLEDYDMDMARHLVAGCDVWLNTPIRPHEASGTSGQKAGLNGLPNLSVLDGWWEEGYNGANGWAAGERREYLDAETRDAADVMALYDLLERDIVPLYYQRDAEGLPRAW